MAMGDYKTDLQSIANSASLTIQPPGATDQWEIHSIFCGAACDIKITDGVDTFTIQALNGALSVEGLKLELTNGVYVLVTNTSGASAVFGYAGVQTK